MSDDARTSACISLPHLRSLIGLRVRHQGNICVIVEVLDSPPSLVLELTETTLAARSPANVMPNLHGQAGEYGSETYVVQVLTDDRTGLHDALLELEILDL